MVHITPLLSAISVLSHFEHTDPESNGLVARQGINSNNAPPKCQSSCKVLATMANCGADLNCLCDTSIGNQLEQCMDCVVSVDSSVQSTAQASLSGWNEGCNGTLTLSSGGSSSSNSGAIGLTAGTMAICIVAAIVGAFVSL